MNKTLALVLVTSAAGLLALSPGWAASKKAAPQKEDDTAHVVPPASSIDEDVAPTPASAAKDFIGTYVGAFGNHRITICLQNVVGQTTINGYSVTAGNERAFSGSIIADRAGVLEMIVHEPGDHPEDGTFDMYYQSDTKVLAGTWKPNNKKLALVSFMLPRRDFRYDPKAGMHSETSTRLLKTSDVENLRSDELRIMRNEIYARHGYTFRLRDMRDYFEKRDWYMPISMNVSTQLTPTEEKNAQLIKHYEAYGTNYYDAFGR